MHLPRYKQAAVSLLKLSVSLNVNYLISTILDNWLNDGFGRFHPYFCSWAMINYLRAQILYLFMVVVFYNATLQKT